MQTVPSLGQGPESRPRRGVVVVPYVVATMAGDRAEELKALANKAVARSQMTAAVGYLTEAIGLRPDMHALWSNRAFALSSLGKHADALSDAKRCIELAPGSSKGYLRAGRALIALGRTADAVDLLEDAVGRHPQDYALQEALGDARTAPSAVPAESGAAAPRASPPAGGGSTGEKLGSSYYYAAVPANERKLPVQAPQRISAAAGGGGAEGERASGMDARGHVQQDIERKGEDSYYYAHQRQKDFTVPAVPKRLNADGTMTPWDGK